MTLVMWPIKTDRETPTAEKTGGYGPRMTISTVRTSCAVRMASIQRPRAGEMSAARALETRRGPGVRASTRAAALMPATNWTAMYRIAWLMVRAPLRRSPSVTCVWWPLVLVGG